MKLDDMIIVSVDDHVVEPPDMWDQLPAKYHDIAPKLVRKDDGTDVWQFHTIEVPNIGLNAVAGRPPDEYGIEPTSFDEIRPGCYDVHQRVLDMSANGTLGSLNFPSLPGFAGRLFAALENKDDALVLAQAYNDWHIDQWCGAHPERFIPCAVPPLWDPEIVAQEIRRVSAKGCHAMTFPENTEPLGMPSLHSDYWRPVWKAASDEGMVLCMHIGSSSKLVMTSVEAPVDVMITLQPMNIVQCAADLIFSPLFTDYPDLTIALSEGGIGWIPYFLERLDHTYRTHHAWTGADFKGRLPSEVFMEHVVLCFITDRVGLKLLDEIGEDRVTVEIDYPHSDANWPTAPERLMADFEAAGTTDTQIDKITHANAMRFFRYDPFSIRPREQCTVGALRAEAAGVDVQPRSTATRPKPERTGPVTIMDLAARATA